MTVKVNLSFGGVIQEIISGLPAGISQILTQIPISENLSVTDGTVLHHFEGQYTPNQDYLQLWTSGDGDFPNLLIVLTDKPIGLTVADGAGSRIWGVTVNGFMVLTLPDPKTPPENFYLEGRDAMNSGVISQGVPVNYIVIGVRGTVTQ